MEGGYVDVGATSLRQSEIPAFAQTRNLCLERGAIHQNALQRLPWIPCNDVRKVGLVPGNEDRASRP